MGYGAVQRAPRFSNLRDVDLSGLADGDAMLWNASTGKWEPGAAGGVQYAASGAGTANRVQMSNASGELVDSIIRQGSVASNFPEITSTNTNVTITTSEQFVLTSYRSSPGASLLLSINYAGLNKKTHIGSSSTPDRMFQVTDNSGNAQVRVAYDASNYGEMRGTLNGYLDLLSTGGRVYVYDPTNAHYVYLSANSSTGSLYTNKATLTLLSDGYSRMTLGATITALYPFQFNGNIGFFGATPTANPVTRYGLSGAGTQNYLQVPNASGELINVPLTVTEASGTATIQNPGGGTKFTFRTDRLGIYHGITGRGRWTSAGFMFGVDGNPERMVEVRDNSGNPQQRWAYDASNYGERELTSGGVLRDTSTGNQWQFYRDTSRSLKINCDTSYTFLDFAAPNQGIIRLNNTNVARFTTTSIQFNGSALGFFNNVAVSQQAHITDADGTLSGNQAAINAILVALENYGLLAAS